MLCIVADGDLVCQAGAKWEDINQHLRDEGIPLFFPVRIHIIVIPINDNSGAKIG